MKGIVKILFLFLIAILPLRVKALSVSENNFEIEKGKNKTIDLYAEVDEKITEVNFSLVYISYDVPAYFNVESGLTVSSTGVKHKIVFPEAVSGKVKLGTIKVSAINDAKVNSSTVNVYSGTAVTEDSNIVNLQSQILNINVLKDQTIVESNNVVNDNDNRDDKINKENSENENKKVEVTNLLEKIESNIVNIKLKENVYEYKVNVKSDIDTLDLNPIVKSEDYSVDVTTQKISELIDNKIIITVKNGDYTEEYKILVNKVSEQEKIEIDDEKFESDFSYKGKWIVLILGLFVVMLVGLTITKKK